MPSAAMIAMMRRVFSVELASATVKSKSRLIDEWIRFGNNARPNRNVKAAMVAADDRNARNGRLRYTERGMLAMASTFRMTMIHVQGCFWKFSCARGIVI